MKEETSCVQRTNSCAGEVESATVWGIQKPPQAPNKGRKTKRENVRNMREWRIKKMNFTTTAQCCHLARAYFNLVLRTTIWKRKNEVKQNEKNSRRSSLRRTIRGKKFITSVILILCKCYKSTKLGGKNENCRRNLRLYYSSTSCRDCKIFFEKNVLTENFLDKTTQRNENFLLYPFFLFSTLLWYTMRKKVSFWVTCTNVEKEQTREN